MFRRRRCLSIGVILVIGLSLVALYVLSANKGAEEKKKVTTISNKEKKKTITTPEIVSKWKAQFDATGRYKTIPFAVTANSWDRLSKKPLCIAVQSSLDRLFQIVEYVQNWHGAVSLTLFTVGAEFQVALNFFNYLRLCYPAVKHQVTVHITYPIYFPPPDISWEYLYIDCQDNASEALKYYQDNAINKTNIIYPQNILRNVAIEHCQTRYVACTDIDMVFPHRSPNSNLTEQLEAFLTSNKGETCKKCAFVLPIYEIDYTANHIPSDKLELLEYIKQKKARQYHKELFSPNQGLSNLDLWERKSSTNVTDVYDVPQFKFWYEPIYIAKRGTPRFDERYVGFGMVRNTQAYEMGLAGYKFKILDNIFLNHRGFQRKGRITVERRKQTDHNLRLFCSTHLRELASRYDADPENLLAGMQKRGKSKYKVMVALVDDKTKSAKKKDDAHPKKVA